MADIDVHTDEHGSGTRKSKIQLEHQQQTRYGIAPYFAEPDYPKARFSFRPYKEASIPEIVVSSIFGLMFLIGILRVFFMPEVEKNLADRVMMYVLFALLIMCVVLIAVFLLARLFKYFKESRVYILPNGFPLSFATIFENYENAPQQLFDLINYYDVKHAQAANPIVAPGEITMTYSPEYMYAPSTTSNPSQSNPIDDDDGDDMLKELLNIPEPQPPESADLLAALSQRQDQHVIIGMDSNNAVIQYPLLKLFNHLVGGTIGSGKSVYLRTLVYQLLTIAENEEFPLEVALADIEDNTFPEFRHCRHVRTYASTYLEIERMTAQLVQEVENRKKLYEQLRNTPRDIERYNLMMRDSGGELLPAIIVVYDEFSALMHRAQGTHKKILSDILQLALRARKYGIFLIIAGQTFKADIVDTSVLGQFNYNVAFQVRDVAQSMMLIGKPLADKLKRPGEAYIKAKDGTLTHVQCFNIDDDTLLDELRVFQKVDLSHSLPEPVRQIIDFTHENLDDTVKLRELETYFKEHGVSRGKLLEYIAWMEDNKLIIRGEKNARKLSWVTIQSFQT